MSAGYDFVVPRWTAVMLALGVSVAARADVYSWTDSDGVAHFTNLKPSGGQELTCAESADDAVAVLTGKKPIPMLNGLETE